MGVEKMSVSFDLELGEAIRMSAGQEPGECAANGKSAASPGASVAGRSMEAEDGAVDGESDAVEPQRPDTSPDVADSAGLPGPVPVAPCPGPL
jgi:hypothetical protein